MKVSFFSDGEETPSTPKADVLFVPRENPRALFIRQPEQTLPASTPVKGTPDARDIATPLHRNGIVPTPSFECMLCNDCSLRH